jgi:hypothetical protein
MDTDSAIAVRVRLETALTALTAARDVARLAAEPDLPLSVSLSVLVDDMNASLARTRRLQGEAARIPFVAW